MAQPFGPIAAERSLVSSDGGTRLRVTLGTPRWNKSEWECPFRIRGRGVSELEFGFGVDSMQALTTALGGIRVVLDRKFSAFGWEGVFPDDSGFPRQLPMIFGRAFSKRLERLVDREYRRHLRQLELRAKRRTAGRRTRASHRASTRSVLTVSK